MTTFGYFMSSEEHGAPALLEQARMAEAAGFEAAWLSDHFHPWTQTQGESPFVWTTLGAIAAATSTLRVHTAVTCPTVRTHPAIIAQAAATTATLMPGRFGLGVGTGEALNEHIFGDAWPSAETRRDMLEESLEVIRKLWTGEVVEHHGEHYTVAHARIYSLPDALPPIHISGFGPRAIELAARIGDGYMHVKPEADAVTAYREHGGTGTTHGGTKVCWGPDRDAAVDLVHELWPNEGLPGELAQILPTTEHFVQASELVTKDMISESIPCGPDPEEHAKAIQAYIDAGYDEVYVNQIGPDQQAFMAFFQDEVRPLLRTA